MARRRWTFVIVNERNGARELRFSRDIVRGVIAFALLAVALTSSTAMRVIGRDGEPTDADARLVRENKLLVAQLAELRSQVDTLRVSLDELAGKDEYFRLLAGLDPVEAGAPSARLDLSRRESPEGHPLYRLDPQVAHQAFTISGELDGLLRRARSLAFSWHEAKDTLQTRYDRLSSTPSILPTLGYISSAFSHRRIHPILSRPRPHLGVDIVARRGTPIHAAAKGRVRFVGTAGEYGLTIEVDHGYGFVTRYAHASRALVRRGQPVERGDIIGRVGETGLVVGPHLHYEVLVNGRQVNPRRYILDYGVVPD
jgi:murein DD-endopeptidase MepM/ murein hydrolase activator NlpD